MGFVFEATVFFVDKQRRVRIPALQMRCKLRNEFLNQFTHHATIPIEPLTTNDQPPITNTTHVNTFTH